MNKALIYTTIWMNLTEIRLSKEVSHKTVHTFSFHLYEVLEQPNYPFMIEVSAFLGPGLGSCRPELMTPKQWEETF